LKRDAMLIRVDCDNGFTGWAPGPGSERAKHVIEQTIAPFLEDRSISDPDALRVQFSASDPDTHTYNVYCAVEIALFDLAAKNRGIPVSELLGGRVRDRIRLYGSAGMYMQPEGYAAEAAMVAAAGFQAYKMRPALGPEKDLETVRLMREVVGPGIALMVDAHSWWRMGDSSYSAETIERLAADMAQFDITWLEEPLPPEDHAGYARLRDVHGTPPLAAGEHEPDEAGFVDLIAGECVDYVQMDVCCQGGYSMGRRLFSAVESEGLRFAFHSWGTDLELAAAAQLGVCWPENVVEWLEYPVYSKTDRRSMYEFPLASEILKQPLHIEGDELLVPARPGLGVEVDESVIQRYPWIPGPWSLFRIDSPPLTLAVTSDHSVKWEGETA
jgi:L-alanine-DL-glutamate epimerase-like enolase superfamily enzyme